MHDELAVRNRLFQVHRGEGADRGMRSLEPGEQLLRIERLLQSTENLQSSAEAVLLGGCDGPLVHTGHEEDLRCGLCVREVTQRAHTVHARHLQVEDDDVGLHAA